MIPIILEELGLHCLGRYLMNELLLWMQNWSNKHFTIYNVDNPGWRLQVNLRHTKYKNIKFPTIEIENTEEDWVHCFTREGNFEGAGGSNNLIDILGIFKQWTSKCEQELSIDKPLLTEKVQTNELLLKWMQDWYGQHCDGDWEHAEHFIIQSTDDPGWLVSINLEETECEGKEFHSINIKNDKEDRYQCFLDKKKFIGKGGPKNLIEILTTFKSWVQKL